MKCEWKSILAKDFIEFNPKITLKKGTIAKKVAMDKVLPYTKYINEFEYANYTGGSKFQNGDTIMARITPCLENGKTAFVDFLDENEIGFGSTEFIVLRERKGISDAQYIYYLSINPQFRKIAINSMVGSSGRQRVQQSVLDELELFVPDINEQRKIANILNKIDEKIRINNIINDNLEKQAQLIFNKIFINIDKVPKNWKYSNLLQIANYTNGLAMQKFRPIDKINSLPVLKIKELRQGYCDNNSELCSISIDKKYIVNNGDVIFSWSGTLLLDIWCSDTCGLNQHLFKITSEKYNKWFYYFWTKYHLNKFISIASSKATTMGHIKREDLLKSTVILPSENDYKKIDALINPIFSKIINIKIESYKLNSIRNKLLPNLITGKIKF
ncbi:restriction endonuclease subunit S [Phascolarctobacterium faecium]|nr:restriction endonuclease subunit S [Phascolarctobacterium faecium]MDM8109358.1 restriction endonuclease subunit S [Phascolarctobacterium faecium]